jgi:hypothetical protein
MEYLAHRVPEEQRQTVLDLITYDGNAETAAGRRLRQVAKQCVSCDQRVQNSVFEYSLDAAGAEQAAEADRSGTGIRRACARGREQVDLKSENLCKIVA